MKASYFRLHTKFLSFFYYGYNLKITRRIINKVTNSWLCGTRIRGCNTARAKASHWTRSWTRRPLSQLISLRSVIIQHTHTFTVSEAVFI